MAKGIRGRWRVTGPTRLRTIAACTLLGLGVLASALTVLAFFAAVRDDYSIDHRTGHADADVLDTSYKRTIVRFVTPDGQVHVPVTGVLYPRLLEDGDRVRVEYDKANPELVRVAGRNWRLGLLPLGTGLLGIWVIAGPGTWLLVRRRRPADPGAQPPTEQLVGHAGGGDE